MTTAEEYYESAMMHLQQGHRPEAVLQMQQALALKPNYPEAWNNRGNLLYQLGNHFDAVLNFDRAIALQPSIGEYHNNRGAALMDLGRMDEAEASYRAAIRLNPKSEHALTNYGNLLKLHHRDFPGAVEHYRRAVAAAPGYVDAHLNLSFALLEIGDFKGGWEEYEWRWKCGQLLPRGLPFIEWDGSELSSGHAILLYTEQGHGDALQFMRYAPLVKRMYPEARVYVELRQHLTRLAKTLSPVDGIIAFGEPLPEGLTHSAALMSLPRILGTSVETIPAEMPYLHAHPWRAAQFAKVIAELPPGPRVGLCWAGMYRGSQPIAADIDKRRSLPLSSFAVLAKIPGISWVNLQLGPPAEQVKAPPPGMTIGDWMPEVEDFYDTAALIENLDLIISVDTAVVHLAGALGKPVWMLSRYDGCWRWMGPRADSPWYPTLRQFRQPKPGDWDACLLETSLALTEWRDDRYRERQETLDERLGPAGPATTFRATAPLGLNGGPPQQQGL